MNQILSNLLPSVILPIISEYAQPELLIAKPNTINDVKINNTFAISCILFPEINRYIREFYNISISDSSHNHLVGIIEPLGVEKQIKQINQWNIVSTMKFAYNENKRYDPVNDTSKTILPENNKIIAVSPDDSTIVYLNYNYGFAVLNIEQNGKAVYVDSLYKGLEPIISNKYFIYSKINEIRLIDFVNNKVYNDIFKKEKCTLLAFIDANTFLIEKNKELISVTIKDGTIQQQHLAKIDKTIILSAINHTSKGIAILSYSNVSIIITNNIDGSRSIRLLPYDPEILAMAVI